MYVSLFFHIKHGCGYATCNKGLQLEWLAHRDRRQETNVLEPSLAPYFCWMREFSLPVCVGARRGLVRALHVAWKGERRGPATEGSWLMGEACMYSKPGVEGH